MPGVDEEPHRRADVGDRGVPQRAVVGGDERAPVPAGAAHVWREHRDPGREQRLEQRLRGVDVMFDPVGGDVFDASRRVVAFEGRILVIGFAGGRFADAPTNHVLVKNYEVVGVHWGFYRTMAPQRIDEWQRVDEDLWARRAINPLVGAELPLADATEALRRLGSRGTTGKVVLVP